MIELENASVHHAGSALLSGVTLRLGNERMALIGPSGAGKSTLLRAVLGLEPLSQGLVRIGGRIATDASHIVIAPDARNIAMVFQDLALWPHLSVSGNLAFGLCARRVPRGERQRRIAEALGSVGLEGKADRLPAQLSGGERQRVAIARALVLDPVALLMDEPLAGLDVVLKSELSRLLDELLGRRNLPTLFVTHDPLEARALASKVAVLDNGRLTQIATTAELRASPASDFARTFSLAMPG